MKIIPAHYQLEIGKQTARYFELLCEEHSLSDEQLLNHGLKLAEENLAELDARIAASTGMNCDEA